MNALPNTTNAVKPFYRLGQPINSGECQLSMHGKISEITVSSIKLSSRKEPNLRTPGSSSFAALDHLLGGLNQIAFPAAFWVALLDSANQSVYPIGVSHSSPSAKRNSIMNMTKRARESMPRQTGETFENFVAELTDAAYQVALRHGAGEMWLDLELSLWKALSETIEKWGPDSPLHAVHR